MLPARHRMRHSGDFARTIRQGSRAGSDLVVVHLALSAPLTTDPTPADPARVGFVVSKAIGNAVQRNLVKRRLRAIVAAQVTDLDDGATVVVRALAPAAQATYVELRDAVGRCIKRARKKVVSTHG